MNQHPQDYYQSTRRMFGYALTFEPEQLYEDIGAPDKHHLATAAKDHIVIRAQARQLLDVADYRGHPPTTFLDAGIDNTYRLLHNEFRKYPLLEPDQAAAIITSPHTAHTIAAVALRGEAATIGLINSQARLSRQESHYHISPDMTHLETTSRLAVQSNYSCPFAGREGRIEPDPLFARFVVWAGWLSIKCYFDHLED